MKTKLLLIFLSISVQSFSQSYIEQEVSAIILNIKEEYPDKRPVVDTVTNVSTIELKSSWKSTERAVITRAHLESLKFEGCELVGIKEEKRHYHAIWRDCSYLVVIEIVKKKKGKKLICKIIKQTYGNIDRAELEGC